MLHAIMHNIEIPELRDMPVEVLNLKNWGGCPAPCGSTAAAAAVIQR